MSAERSLQSTVDFMVASHSMQFRKHSGMPYSVHPFQVLALVSDWGVCCPISIERGNPKPDGILWRAALCHDILEDCPDATIMQLVYVAGEPAAKVTQELTFVFDETKGTEKNVQKDEYLKTFDTKSIRALIIKCADRICNTRDFIIDSPDYARKYWNKASPLFVAFHQRKAEIARHGTRVYERMLKSIQEIEARLNEISIA